MRTVFRNCSVCRTKVKQTRCNAVYNTRKQTCTLPSFVFIFSWLRTEYNFVSFDVNYLPQTYDDVLTRIDNGQPARKAISVKAGNFTGDDVQTVDESFYLDEMFTRTQVFSDTRATYPFLWYYYDRPRSAENSFHVFLSDAKSTTGKTITVFADDTHFFFFTNFYTHLTHPCAVSVSLGRNQSRNENPAAASVYTRTRYGSY